MLPEGAIFGGYERWMLRFWMFQSLDVISLDASIHTRFCLFCFVLFFFLEVMNVGGCGLGNNEVRSA